MFVKVLGLVDLVLGLVLIFESPLNLSTGMLVFFGIVFLAKASFGFFKDIASWIDTLTGIIFLLLIIFNIPLAIKIIVGILVIQKGVFSFL